MKKFLSTTLAVAMALALAVSAFATTTPTPTSTPTSEVSDEDGIMPFKSRQVVENERITTDGTSWVQPLRYKSYKIWIHNTTDEEMIITHCAGASEEVYRVPARKMDVVCIENNAIPFVKHTLDFSIPSGGGSGEVLGTVAVRVSTIDQYE